MVVNFHGYQTTIRYSCTADSLASAMYKTYNMLSPGLAVLGHSEYVIDRWQLLGYMVNIWEYGG